MIRFRRGVSGWTKKRNAFGSTDVSVGISGRRRRRRRRKILLFFPYISMGGGKGTPAT